MFSKSKRDFIKTVKQVAETEAGQRMLAYLRKDLIDSVPCYPSPYDMYFQIGYRKCMAELVGATDYKLLDLVVLTEDNNNDV